MTECYEQVRGSGIRVTGLDRCGGIPDVVRYATSRCVARVRINEVIDAGSNELLRSEEGEPRLRVSRPEQTLGYRVDVDFLNTDPGVLHLISGVPMVTNAMGNIVGFDASTKLPAASFGMEVWSRLARSVCEDGSRKHGLTLFPFLYGGVLSGFQFSNSLVSFNLRGARTRRYPKWSVGPYDYEGPQQRLLEPVSGNTHWRNFVTPAPPPADTCGIIEFDDVIEGGNAAFTTEDEIDGGDSVNSGPWIIDGGWA